VVPWSEAPANIEIVHVSQQWTDRERRKTRAREREIAIARACSAVRVSASTAVRPWTNLTWVNNFTIVDCNQLINYIIVNQFNLFFIFFWYAMFQNVFMDPKILKIN
jgi:hypothetical protein